MNASKFMTRDERNAERVENMLHERKAIKFARFDALNY